jgi:hypothetical protein
MIFYYHWNTHHPIYELWSPLEKVCGLQIPTYVYSKYLPTNIFLLNVLIHPLIQI